MHQLNLLIQIATATLLGLVCILLAKHSRSGLNTWTGIGFTISIFCYMVVESDAIQSVVILRITASIGAICIPILFWLLATGIPNLVMNSAVFPILVQNGPKSLLS